MPSRRLQIAIDQTDRTMVEAALAARIQDLEDAALEHARIQERRAMIESLDVDVSFESDTAGTVSLDFGWTVRNACADQTFADRGQLRLKFSVDDGLLTLHLPPQPLEREPDEI